MVKAKSWDGVPGADTPGLSPYPDDEPDMERDVKYVELDIVDAEGRS